MAKILHVTTNLLPGGAETMLYKLLSRADRERFEPAVVSLMGSGGLGPHIEDLGVPVHALGLRGMRPEPGVLRRLLRVTRDFNPDLVQGWLVHGNLAAALAGAIAPRRVPVLWTVQYSLYSMGDEKRTTAAMMRVGARLSGLPAKVIYDSEVSVAQHQAIGYRSDKAVVIPTGLDTERFSPSAEARAGVRSELGVEKNTVLIGLVARYHPMKDHANFLRAAALLLNEHPDVRFVLSGSGVDKTNETLTGLIRDLGIGERVHLLGYYPDVPRLTAALDIASLSSYSEGSPTTVVEAMSCGVPCVVTDVGGTASIVGETGRVVPPRNSRALCAAWSELVEMGPALRRELGLQARRRIKGHFSIEGIARRYERVYEEQLNSA